MKSLMNIVAKIFKKFVKAVIIFVLAVLIFTEIVFFMLDSTTHVEAVSEEFDEYSQHAKYISHHIDDPGTEKTIHETLYEISKNTGIFLTDAVDLYSTMIETTGGLPQEALHTTEAIINYIVADAAKADKDRGDLLQNMQGIGDILRSVVMKDETVRVEYIHWLSDQLPTLAQALAQAMSSKHMEPEEARVYLEKLAQSRTLRAQAFLLLKNDLVKSRRYVRAHWRVIEDTIILSEVSSINHSLYWLVRWFVW